mmetsp:Transcript_23503/g.41000  ORF Transcript_23503/g.41000 Transcript_23503/m.41000 type:complete len:257 (+) Transcript_23503:85-855(+)|eukprot:CAMPEP_0194713800 /NCGR_PEP_ID=MMETSP0296-20130528/5598_1 /TAXON_ID=39354 /ORGANISM="Heterosigma akashiwo, Strain CCMP2393" /LENGTH=256 /DNA_ID=CAMNT_0039612711 /DNA_START=39 /DNA_END=809 /DNA_ORIENTATION=+
MQAASKWHFAFLVPTIIILIQDLPASTGAFSEVRKLIKTDYAMQELWTECTEAHPFLQGCFEGNLDDQKFDTWLVQDYHFVKTFQEFVGDGVYKKAPAEHRATIRDGIAALEDELVWFQQMARSRNIEGLEDAILLPANVAYRKYLQLLVEEGDYTILAVAFWAIEVVYQEAWARVLEGGARRFHEFAARWGNDGFGAYVAQLEKQADEALVGAGSHAAGDAAAVLKQVMQLEVGFWQMAFEGGGGGEDSRSAGEL